MSESMNNFPKDLFDLIESEFSRFEDVMDDTRIKDGESRAKLLEHRVNAGEVEDLQSEIGLLDREVGHVIGQGCFVTGAVTILTGDGTMSEGRRVNIEDLHVEFNGYAPVKLEEDSDEFRIAYVMTVFEDESGLFTRSRLEEYPDDSPEALSYAAVALVGDVSFDFAISTPERAMAWLDLMYPETLSELDRILLSKVEDGKVGIPTYEEALYGLRDFELVRPEGMSSMGWLDYKNAVAQYVGNMATLDPGAPYSITVRGPRLVRDDDGESACYTNQPPVWFNVSALVFCDRSNFNLEGSDTDEVDTAIFSMRGTELADDVYDPLPTVIIPFASMDSLLSLRSIQAAA